ARRAGGDVDRAFLLERAQVLLGGVHGTEAHLLRDLGARRRIARHLGQFAHQLEDLALPCCQFFHDWKYIQYGGNVQIGRSRASSSLAGALTRRLTGWACTASSGAGASRADASPVPS